MAIKVRLPDGTVIEALGIVVEGSDGSSKDFSFNSSALEEAIKYNNELRVQSLITFLDTHFYLRHSDDFVKSYINLYPNEKKELIELLQLIQDIDKQ